MFLTYLGQQRYCDRGFLYMAFQGFYSGLLQYLLLLCGIKMETVNTV